MGRQDGRVLVKVRGRQGCCGACSRYRLNEREDSRCRAEAEASALWRSLPARHWQLAGSPCGGWFRQHHPLLDILYALPGVAGACGSGQEQEQEVGGVKRGAEGGKWTGQDRAGKQREFRASKPGSAA